MARPILIGHITSGYPEPDVYSGRFSKRTFPKYGDGYTAGDDDSYTSYGDGNGNGTLWIENCCSDYRPNGLSLRYNNSKSRSDCR